MNVWSAHDRRRGTNLNGVDAAGSAVCAAQASRVGAVADLLVHVVLVGEWLCLHARNLDGGTGGE